MSSDWVRDMHFMHKYYGFHEALERLSDDDLKTFLEFRIKFLEEELKETRKAASDHNPEEIVDGLIDLCVVAIGTLDLFGIDSHEAWNEVLRANMEKRVGVKEGRPNPLELPDLVKPEGWTGPDHSKNTGILDKLGESTQL